MKGQFQTRLPLDLLIHSRSWIPAYGRLPWIDERNSLEQATRLGPLSEGSCQGVTNGDWQLAMAATT
jgi:hypothetical protein